MWEQLVNCAAPREVAFCIPFFGGGTFAIYWYGILASLGIFVGAYYAAKHVEWEGQDPDLIWDALLWVLVAGLLGGRLWYVLADVMGGNAGGFSLSDPLGIINPRSGGMNIFGGAVGGLIAALIFARRRQLPGWLILDAGFLGLLLGQGIGRFGNLINQELYGPPTGSPWFGMLIEQTKRLAEFQSFPADTRFHPTMLYEAFWLFLVFGVLFYLFRRYQEQIVHGVMTGAYLILAGLGRFVMEFWRPDQPGIPTGIGEISFSRMFAMLYVVVGIIVLLDRTGHMRIPLWKRPPSRRQRLTDYEEIQVTKRRRQRHQELEKRRAARRKERAAAAEPDSESQTETANESS